MEPISFVILGQAASKANSRRLVSLGGKPRFIKSKEALAFMRDARRQIPPVCRLRIQGPVAVTLRMFYLTERPDLDESVVLDAMQDHFVVTKLADGRVRRDLAQAGVYVNDRLVREKHVYHFIDRRQPRVEVEVRSIAPTDDLFANEAPAARLPF